MRHSSLIGFLISFFTVLCTGTHVEAQTDWPTAGANPARTSQNSVEVRGEAGLDINGNQGEPSQIYADSKGTWLHNFLWASLYPGGLIELYWWDKAIGKGADPDGNTANGLMEIYGYFKNFAHNIPLSNDHYVDAQAALSNTSLRIVGQKDTVNHRAHLWVQNPNHTRKKVVDGTVQTGLSGTVTLTGFSPNTSLKVEQHQFTTSGLPSLVTSTLKTNASGALVLALPTDSQIIDVGLKIGDYSDAALPTSPPLLPGDLDSDGDIDFLDILTLISWTNLPSPRGLISSQTVLLTLMISTSCLTS